MFLAVGGKVNLRDSFCQKRWLFQSCLNRYSLDKICIRQRTNSSQTHVGSVNLNPQLRSGRNKTFSLFLSFKLVSVLSPHSTGPVQFDLGQFWDPPFLQCESSEVRGVGYISFKVLGGGV